MRRDRQPTPMSSRTACSRRIRRLTFGDVTDGLSNTIAVFESGGRPFLYRLGRQVGADLSVHRLNGGGWARPASDILLTGSNATGNSSAAGVNAGVFINRTNGYDHGPESYAGTNGYPAPWGTEGSSQPYSFHPGGLNVLIGDGAVKFVDEAINIGIVAALVTRKRRRWRGLEQRRHHLPRRVHGTTGRVRKGAVVQCSK